MVAINSSSILPVLQKTLHSELKNPGIYLLPALVKIGSINHSPVDFLCGENQPLDASPTINKSVNQPTAASVLIASLKRVINEMPLSPESVKASHNTPDTPVLTSTFRLAAAIDSLYPRPVSSGLDGFDRFVIFGDSLSDSEGRMFEKTHHIFPSYNQYYDGRFTNGFVWGEYLSSPAFLNKELVNFAEGGSTSASYSRFNLLGDFLSNIETQIKSYQPSERDMTLFFAGANDYITLHKDNIIHVVEKQIDDITKLLDGGVNHALVMGMPDISLTPDSKYSEDKRKYKDITIAHNELLQQNVEELKEKYPDKKIFFFDTTSALKKIIKVADDIGYDTRHSYTKHGYIHNPVGSDPELNIAPAYLYNDGVHPTQEVHHAFATLLTNFISHNYASQPAIA